MGLKGRCITGVVNKISMEKITKETLKAGEENAIRAAIAARSRLIVIGSNGTRGFYVDPYKTT